MKDIPVFATENGVAALSLQQIAYTGIAHITIHSTQSFTAFLEECIDFCRAVGAERILACGHEGLSCFPVYTRILSMQMDLPEDASQDCLFPITEASFDEWLKIYNDGMKGVPNALILSKQMGKALMEKGIAYFVHNSGDVLGIGIAEVDTIQAVVSCKRGCGERSMRALFGVLCGDVVKVEVAENNLPAMKLYSRMGFIQTGVIKCWYDVTKNILDVK